VALADTAKLVVALGLDDKGFSGGLRSANRSLGTFQSGLGQTGKGIGQLGAGVGRVATSLIKLGAAGVVAVGGFLALNLKAGVAQVKLLEQATAQTEAVLKSTAGVAGETAASIRDLSLKYEDLNATIDDKVIQSGENLLLTFTNIHKEAFEPALKAALDMNQAMGGGEEGLQSTIIRLGKALQDPVRGFTALRRVGVNLTQEQQRQIKTLVAQNDLYGAQQIILKELAIEFGGSFARAGDTAAARTERLHDRVEDLQRVFAGPFANVLDRITGKLGDFLGEAGTVDAVTRLGSGIAGLFTDATIDRGIGILRTGLELLSPANLAKIGEGVKGAFEFVKSIDFETIGKGLQITAGIAKTAIDAFLSLPPEVQSIAIAALAANKLSGGLLASGIGNVAGGLLRLALGSLKTITAANVTVVGANVAGGIPGAPAAGAPAAAGGASLLQKVFLTGIAAEAGFLLGSAVSNALVDAGVAGIKPAKEREQQKLADTINSGDVERIVAGIDSIDENLKPTLLDMGLSLKDSGAAIALALDIGGVKSQLEHDRQVLLDQLTQMGLTRAEAEKIVAAQQAATAKYGQTAVQQIAAVNALKLPLGLGNVIAAQIRDEGAQTVAAQQGIAQNLGRWGGKLDVIAAKDFSPIIKVNTVVTVTNSAAQIVQSIRRYTESTKGDLLLGIL
jgi:hypothetical protein